VKTVAETLEVSRSNLVRRSAGQSKPRGRYAMTEDATILPEIRTVIDERATYGYRRVTALVNRRRAEQNLPLLNHKRVYRLMHQNNLLLTRHTGKPRDCRTHEGQVITIRSNLRWSSDGFEIPCWDGGVVRVMFVIDTCDREIIAWGGTTTGFDGETARDLMLISVERRFADYQAATPVEWLTDNGSCYDHRLRPAARPGAVLHARAQSGIERHR
jgi:transposase InsO family protein